MTPLPPSPVPSQYTAVALPQTRSCWRKWLKGKGMAMIHLPRKTFDSHCWWVYWSVFCFHNKKQQQKEKQQMEKTSDRVWWCSSWNLSSLNLVKLKDTRVFFCTRKSFVMFSLLFWLLLLLWERNIPSPIWLGKKGQSETWNWETNS